MMMARLKATTRPLHEAVEARLDLFRLTRSIEGYARALKLFYGLHDPLEGAFARLPGWDRVGLDPSERRKAHLLRADLRRLGLDEAALDALPRCPTPPPVPDLPAALGAMYVLEGSTLGGRSIRKRVEEALGLTPDDGCAYFSSYGDRVGPMWKAFGAAVDAFATEEEVRESIEQSAVATFRAVDAWFADGA